MMTSNSHIFQSVDCCRNCNVLIVFARHSIFTASCQFNMCHSIFGILPHILYIDQLYTTQRNILYLFAVVCQTKWYSYTRIRHNTDTCYIFTSNQIFISPAASFTHYYEWSFSCVLWLGIGSRESQSNVIRVIDNVRSNDFDIISQLQVHEEATRTMWHFKQLLSIVFYANR